MKTMNNTQHELNPTPSE